MAEQTTYRVGMFSVERRRDQALIAVTGTVLIPVAAWALATLARMGRTAAEVRLASAWARTVIRVLGVDAEIEGLHHLPDQPSVLLPLHEGFLDPPLLMSLGRPARFIARQELFEWKHLGRVLRQGHVQLPLGASTPELRRLYRECHEAIRGGHDLVVFPQGSVLGVEVAFSTSAFRLARSTGAPIVPIVITGSHRVWEHPYSPTLRRGCRVRLEVLPAFEGADVAAWRKLERTMKQIALDQEDAPVRRFDPDRDGYWDGYSYTIDNAFPEVAAQVERHRASAESGEETLGIVGSDHESLP